MLPADIPDRLVDVAVHCQQVQVAVQIDIQERASEAEAIAGSLPDARLAKRHRCRCRFGFGAIERDHFVVEVGDGDARRAGIIEIGRHRRPCRRAPCRLR